MTLEDYLRKNCENNIIDHAIRATVLNGVVEFYIHPLGVDGDTLDFEVDGNVLSSWD